MNSLYGLSTTNSRITGLASGLDIDTMVYDMTATARARIDSEYYEKQYLLWEQEAYRDSITQLTEFRDKYMNVGEPETNMLSLGFYNSTKFEVSGVDGGSATVSATATSSAAKQDLDVDVKSLASAQKITSSSSASKGISGHIGDLDSLFLTKAEIPGATDSHPSIGTPKTMSIQLLLDGTSKGIDFSLDETIGPDATAEEIYENLELNLQEALDEAFGISSDGVSSRVDVQIDENGEVLFTTSGASTLTVGNRVLKAGDGYITDSTVIGDTVTGNDLLGITAAASNRQSTSRTLEESTFATELLGNDFNFSINGVDFSFTREDTLSTVINTINASAANVKVSYSNTTDRFTMESSIMGSGNNIEIEQSTGNLLTSMFGIAEGGSYSSGSLHTITEDANNSFDFSAGKELAGKSFNLTIDGVTKTITLPAYTDDNSNMYDEYDPDAEDAGTEYDRDANLITQINNLIEEAFGHDDVQLKYTDSSNSTLRLESSTRSRSFSIENPANGDKALISSLGFYSGQGNSALTGSVSLASIGITDVDFNISGQFAVNGEVFEVSDFNVSFNSSVSLSKVLSTELTEGFTLGDIMSIDSATGEITLNLASSKDAVITETSNAEGTTFLETLFGTSDITGSTTNELGVHTYESSLTGFSGSTTLAELGITDGSLQLSGKFEVAGELYDYDTTIDVTGDMTLDQLLGRQVTSVEIDGKAVAMSLGEIFKVNEDTGTISLDTDSGANFELTETGTNMLTTLFGAATIEGDSVVENGVITRPAADSIGTATMTAGSNAVIEVNGVTLERATNSVSFDGINLTLNSVGKSTIKAVTDVTQIVDTLKDFIDAYNEIIEVTRAKLTETKSSSEREYNPLTPDQMAEMTETEIENWDAVTKKGIVRNDPLLTKVLDDLRAVLYNKPEGSELSIFDIGISTSAEWNDGGKLVIEDESELLANIEKYADSIGDLFANYNNDGIIQQFDAVLNEAISTTGATKGYLVERAGVVNTTTETDNYFNDQIADIDDKIEALQEKYEEEQERYYSQFTALETYMNEMNSQATWLSQQFATE